MKKSKSVSQLMVEQSQIVQDMVNMVIHLARRVQRLEAILANPIINLSYKVGKKTKTVTWEHCGNPLGDGNTKTIGGKKGKGKQVVTYDMAGNRKVRAR